MKVDTLHFLVHPGFHIAFNKKEPGELLKGLRSMDRELFHLYKRKIDSLGQDDVLVIFSPTKHQDYRKDIEEDGEWFNMDRYAKEKMGRRCISMSNPNFLPAAKDRDEVQEVFYPTDTGIKELKPILKARNFEVNEYTKCEVWGQAAGVCVARTAGVVYQAFPFVDLPITPAKSTDLFDLDPDYIEKFAEELREKHSFQKIVNKR